MGISHYFLHHVKIEYDEQIVLNNKTSSFKIWENMHVFQELKISLPLKWDTYNLQEVLDLSLRCSHLFLSSQILFLSLGLPCFLVSIPVLNVESQLVIVMKSSCDFPFTCFELFRKSFI